MAAASSLTTPKSAIALVPPPHLWPAIQAIRAAHDKSFIRWPPHVNLLYPFLEDKGSNFDDAEALLAGTLKSVKPFWLSLSHLGHFVHNGKSATIWLHPTPAKAEPGEEADPVVSLQSLLVSAFPQCDELNKRSTLGFRPHLSLGQWGASGIESAKLRLQSEWDSATTTDPAEGAASAGAGSSAASRGSSPAASARLWFVDRICLMSRSGFEDPFAIRKEIPLIGSDAGISASGLVSLARCIPHPPPLTSLPPGAKKQTGLPKKSKSALPSAAGHPAAPAFASFPICVAPAGLAFPPPDLALLLPD